MSIPMEAFNSVMRSRRACSLSAKEASGSNQACTSTSSGMASINLGSMISQMPLGLVGSGISARSSTMVPVAPSCISASETRSAPAVVVWMVSSIHSMCAHPFRSLSGVSQRQFSWKVSMPRSSSYSRTSRTVVYILRVSTEPAR